MSEVDTATPMLRVTNCSKSASATGVDSARRSRVTISTTSSSPDTSHSTVNSSPPNRAM